MFFFPILNVNLYVLPSLGFTLLSDLRFPFFQSAVAFSWSPTAATHWGLKDLVNLSMLSELKTQGIKTSVSNFQILEDGEETEAAGQGWPGEGDCQPLERRYRVSFFLGYFDNMIMLCVSKNFQGRFFN